MREDALITEVRIAAQLPDTFADYPDARIRTELNNVLQERFAPILVAARCGMLLKRYSLTLASGTSTYPLPARAMAAGFECLDISDGTTYWPLQEVLAHQIWEYETLPSDRPRYFAVVGSSVRLYPTPNAAYTVRIQYYLRPPQIVEKQSNLTFGLVSSVDLSERQLLVPQWTNLVDRRSGLALTEGTRVDVIRGPVQSQSYEVYDANYEVVAVGLRWVDGSFPSSSMALTDDTQDITEVRAGDLVRAFDQSEWPTMPHEYHVILAKAAAARICRDRGMYSSAQALDELVDDGLRNMKDAVQPRVKSQAQPLKVPGRWLRGRRFF